MGFDPLEGACDNGQFIRVLDGLGYQLGHRAVKVTWDNLGAHHADDLAAGAKEQPLLELAYLPAYAPELNPVEGLWANPGNVSWPTAGAMTAKELIATAQVGSILRVVT